MAIVINNDTHVEYPIGTSAFTNGDATFTGQFYLRVNRASSFQTYFGHGPTGPFTSNNYYVHFDGSGGVSNNYAIGFDGNDTYHGSQTPITGRWVQMAMRYTANGASSELKGYFDLNGPLSTTITATVATLTWQSNSVLSWGAAPWDEAGNSEYIDGQVQFLKAWERALTDADIAMEATHWDLMTPTGSTNLWGRWPLIKDLNDYSGNNRHLSWATGVGTFLALKPQSYQLSHRPAPFVPGIAR